MAAEMHYTLGRMVIIVWVGITKAVLQECDRCSSIIHYSVYHCTQSLLPTINDVQLIDTRTFLCFSGQIYN